MTLFQNIDKLNKKLEAFYTYEFKTSLAELKNKKTILSLLDEEYFILYEKVLIDLQIQIDNTDNEIDAMVYELHGLTKRRLLWLRS